MSPGNANIKHLIERMRDEKHFPAISKYITELNAKASPSSESSASELAALILCDYSLTARLLKVSNSAMYGQFSGTISTVSRAVVVLGFEQVQLTAAGLIFFEHLQDKAKSHYIKEAMLTAFLSGILARELAKTMGLKNWESFYIGAMLHNFGRLLAMYYFKNEFDEIRRLHSSEKLDEEIASRRVLGASFSELGIGVARSWSLPAQITDSMKVPLTEEFKKSRSKVNHHQLLPHFANELCDLAMNAPASVRQQKLETLLRRYAKPYPVRQKEVVALLEAAIEELQKFTEVLHLDRNDLKRLDRCSFVPPEKEAAAPAPQPSAALDRFEIAASEPPSAELKTIEERKKHLQGGIQEITNVMLDEFNLDEILSMILETIYRGIGFDRVIIFFKNPQSGSMQARYGLGPDTRKLVGHLDFPVAVDGRDLFSIALNNSKDLYIGNIADREIRDLKPAWFDGPLFSPSLAIYPVVVNGKAIGLIYGGHDLPGTHLDQEQLSAIKTLRNQAALAIKQCAAST